MPLFTEPADSTPARVNEQISLGVAHRKNLPHLLKNQKILSSFRRGKIELFLLRSLSEAATLFVTDRVGPGRFIICDLSRSDFFRWR